MEVSPLVRVLGMTATILASCQGLVWSVLSLIGILIYTEAWTPVVENLTELQISLFQLFLVGDGADTEDHIMAGDTMIIFTSIYLPLSLIWMIISLSMLWVVWRQKWEYGKCTFITWGVLTECISILDIVTMALLASDFKTISDTNLEEAGESPSYSMISAVGVMMTVAARGFAILIANIIFGILFLRWGICFDSNIDNKDNKDEPKREIINGFQQDQRPMWLANGNNNSGLGRPFSNSGYENELQQRVNPVNQNRYTPPLQEDNFGRFGRSNNNVRPYQNQPTQERSPYIPAPDYSPPSLQKHPKSVLKSRTHY